MLTDRGEATRTLHVLYDEPVVTPDDFEDAYPSGFGDDPGVAFALTAAAGRRLAATSQRYVGGRLAVVLDDQVFGAPVRIADRIGRYGRIDAPGGVTDAELYALAVFLRTGPLPAPVVVADHGVAVKVRN